MRSNLQEPRFMIFADLMQKLKLSHQALHDLILKGAIVPAVFLKEEERKVGGVFRGGSYVGDIEASAYLNCGDYYVGTDPDEDSFQGNWPQCSSIMYCHHPVGNAVDGYSFRFLSESPDPRDTKEWFCLAKGERIGSDDGVDRFRFVWSPELKQYEGKYVPAQLPIEIEMVSPPVPSSTFPPFNKRVMPLVPPSPTSPLAELSPATSHPPVSTTVRRPKGTRRRLLDWEIEQAVKMANDPADIHSVWTEFLNLAEEEKGCLLGIVDGQVKYRGGNGRIGFFTKDKLGERQAFRKGRA